MNIISRRIFIRPKSILFKKELKIFIAVLLSFNPVTGYAQEMASGYLPVPGTKIYTSEAYTPMLVRGLKMDPAQPLKLDFIVDTGQSPYQPDGQSAEKLKSESQRLIKYFLAGLTIPADDLWVNLSPYEKDRMITDALGATVLGCDMLGQDYILKQLTATMIDPEKELGQTFWDKVNREIRSRFGDSQAAVQTFNKVWIVPEQAAVYENGNAVFVTQAKLKVMLEQDYLALEKGGVSLSDHKRDTHTDASRIVKEIIVPAIEKEVNEGKNFASLRQIFYSLILARWYKETIKESLLTKVYTDQNKTDGVDVADKNRKELIYKQYIEAFQKGVFNYIKEDMDPQTQESQPRKYFSGGMARFGTFALRYDATPPEIKGPGHLINEQVDLRLPQRGSSSSLEERIAKSTVELVILLNQKGIHPKINGTDLIAFTHDAMALIKFIQHHSVLKNPDDIRRVLAWRYNIASGLDPRIQPPLSGMKNQTAEMLYASIFDQPRLLSMISLEGQPLEVVILDRGRSQPMTHLLRTLGQEVNVKVVLSGTNDGLSWFYGAREFSATGISGAGRALVDLARNLRMKSLLEMRFPVRSGRQSLLLAEDFRVLVSKLLDSSRDDTIAQDMQEIYNEAMKLPSAERIALARDLDWFRKRWEEVRKDSPDSPFTIAGVPLRSIALVGIHERVVHEERIHGSKGIDFEDLNWQKAVDAMARILDVEKRHRVILPTEERQHLVALRSDGTVYLSETAINLYETKAPFLGLWLVDNETYGWLAQQHSITARVEGREVNIGLNRYRRNAMPDNMQALSGSPQQREVLETVRKINPRFAPGMVDFLSMLSSTSENSLQEIPLTNLAKQTLEKADVILYSNERLESNVGATLIVPGVEEAISHNTGALKISLAEVEETTAPGVIAETQARLYNYASGQKPYLPEQQAISSLGNYVDYVLAGVMLNDTPGWLAGVLGGIEESAGLKVQGVSINAPLSREQGLFPAVEFRNALIALMGLKKAGHLVSDRDGLMPEAMAKDRAARQHAPTGLFRNKKNVTETIDYIRQHWTQIIKDGAFAFDVDMTILPKGSRGLHEYYTLAYYIMRLLRKGVRVAIISGNSQQEQMDRIYAAIKNEMQDDLSALTRLTFYVNGGATKFGFDEKGEPVPDAAYNNANSFNYLPIKTAIDKVLPRLARRHFGLSGDNFQRYLRVLEDYIRKEYGILQYSNPWDGSNWTPEWVTSDEARKRAVSGQNIIAPWIEYRGEILGPEGQVARVASLAIKPTPKFNLYDKTVVDVRDIIQSEIEKELRTLGVDPGQFNLRGGGTSTTDITNRDTEKPSALWDYIHSNHLNPNFVFYHGDEFFVRKGKTGNDEVIARSKRGRLPEVRKLAYNVDNMEGAQESTIWMGRTPQGLLEYLEVALEGSSPLSEGKIRASSASAIENPGGIDLKQINVQRSGNKIKFDFSDQQIQKIFPEGFHGFEPAIINISPVNNLPLFLGISDKRAEKPGTQLSALPYFTNN